MRLRGHEHPKKLLKRLKVTSRERCDTWRSAMELSTTSFFGTGANYLSFTSAGGDSLKPSYVSRGVRVSCENAGMYGKLVVNQLPAEFGKEFQLNFKAIGEGPGRDKAAETKDTKIASRRQVLLFGQSMMASAGVSTLCFSYALAATEKVTTFTNIDDARKAGEKLREEKEAAEGPVIVSSTGIKYRELERGTGRPVAAGDLVSIYYTISRLNGYYLDSMGYGKEGKNDVGEALKFQYGKGLVPEAIEGGMEGMREGARRRILVTPERGWVRPDLLPRPTSFFAERRLSERIASQALLIEIELVKVKDNNL